MSTWQTIETAPKDGTPILVLTAVIDEANDVLMQATGEVV